MTAPTIVKLGTKHSWVKCILVYSNEGPRIFPMGDNYKITKVYIFFIQPSGQFQPNFAKSIPGKRGFQFVQTERSHLFTLGNNNKIAKVHSRNLKIFSYWANFKTYTVITSLNCFNWFELVFRVSDLAHGPHVISCLLYFRKNYLLQPYPLYATEIYTLHIVGSVRCV